MGFGLAQALALVPGVSRSGGTITAGLLMGFTREAAARYSFLLAIPAVLGLRVLPVAKSVTGEPGSGAPGFGATLVATLVAFVVGYLVIIAFLKSSRRQLHAVRDLPARPRGGRRGAAHGRGAPAARLRRRPATAAHLVKTR